VRVHAALGAILLVGAFGLAGCGESKEEKALKTACAARSEVKQQVEHLRTLSPTPAALGEIKTDTEAIVVSVKKMADAAKELAPSRKQEVEAATKAFEQEAQDAFAGVKASGSPTALLSQLSAGLEKLGAAYTNALAPVKC
jgi:hypothetical protein